MEDIYSYYPYVKKLGERHIANAMNTTGKTLCGKPMLGNNYAADFHRRNSDMFFDCKKCLVIFERQTGQKWI